jgi:site-specific recombinase XerD
MRPGAWFHLKIKAMAFVKHNIYHNSTSKRKLIKISVVVREYKPEPGGFFLYVRVRYNNAISEIKSEVHVMSREEVDPKDSLPKDLQKRHFIMGVIDDLYSIGSELERGGLLKHPRQIIKTYSGKTVPGVNLLSTFEDFMRHQKNEVRCGNLSKGTLKNYFTTQRYLKRFVNDEFGVKDIPLGMFDRRFLDCFSAWMTENTESNNNGKAKHFERLKRFVTLQRDYGVLIETPFRGFKLKVEPKKRVYLEEKEVELLRELTFTEENEKIEISRDVFLFMCNTGLSYSDVFGLKEEDIEQRPKGKVISSSRKKTGVDYLVPLTEEALGILDKYTEHEKVIETGRLLPVYCNQIFNRHLKTIQEMAGITKTLTSHVARHSFATIALTADVPLVTIQRVLGHSDMRMTQHYSRLVDKKLLKDMKSFKKLMDGAIDNHPIKDPKKEETDSLEEEMNLQVLETKEETEEIKINSAEKEGFTPHLKIV